MKLLGDQTTLVLAGAWNPAILNPSWIGRHVLKLPQGNAFQVEMLMPVQGQAGPTRLSFEGISVTPAQEAIIFHINPEDDAMVAKTFDVAKRILELLPHTPVSAMGVNFAYQVDPMKGKLPKTVEWVDGVGDLLTDELEANILSRQWQVGISAMNHMINVAYRSDAQGGKISVNHHYEVEGSAAKAATYLGSEGLFGSLLDLTNKLVDGLERDGV